MFDYTPALQSPCTGTWPGDRVKIRLIWFVSLICENTHKVSYKKSLKLTLQFKLNDIKFWPFNPSPGPQEAGENAIARLIYVSNSHTKFSWILSNGLGGDSITDRRTDRRMVGGNYNIPFAFLKNVVIKTKILMVNGSLVRIECIIECSPSEEEQSTILLTCIKR